MKLFPVIAALALVGTIGQIANADSITDPLTGSMTIDDFFSRFIEDVESSSTSASMASSASGSMEFETFEDLRSYVIDQIKSWSEGESQAMVDWVGSSSDEFKEFEQKMKATERLVAKIKKLPDLESSVKALEPIMTELGKKTDQVNAFVNATIEKSQKEGTTFAGSMNLLEFFELMSKNSTSESGSDATSTGGSDDESITQKSVPEESTTQSSPSFQKTWDKLTGSAPAAKSTK